MHCGRCCPPRPLSPEQIKRIGSILMSARSTPQVPASVPVPKPPTRKQLEHRVADLEAEVARLQEVAEGSS